MKTRKYENTKKTMRIFVFFRYRVFVIALIFFATEFTIFTTRYII
jgi:hypothetical protein